jgi:hypothetical protein
VLATILQSSRSQDVAGEIEELAGLTEEHVIEEEMDLFPTVRKLFDGAELRELADRMTQLEAPAARAGRPAPSDAERAGSAGAAVVDGRLALHGDGETRPRGRSNTRAPV